MVRVAEHYPRPGCPQVNGVDGPDRPLRRDRHEKRRGNVAASGAQHTDTRAAVGGLELERTERSSLGASRFDQVLTAICQRLLHQV